MRYCKPALEVAFETVNVSKWDIMVFLQFCVAMQKQPQQLLLLRDILLNNSFPTRVVNRRNSVYVLLGEGCQQ